MGREKSPFFQMILTLDPESKRTDANAKTAIARREARPSEGLFPFPPVPRQRRRRFSSLIFQPFKTKASKTTIPSSTNCYNTFYASHYAYAFFTVIIILLSYFLGAVEGRSQNEHSPGDSSPQSNSKITCYTCVNVSSNEECNRFAIDRPCPGGKDYCLTLHVMEEALRSVLVNKRCATFEDCSGDSTGCYSLYGQMHCTSCCDQAYCNDFVPSNRTTAIFHRSSAAGTISRRGYAQVTQHVAMVMSSIALTTIWTRMNLS